MKDKAVLLDTSFFIRFLDESGPLFISADKYFRYFLDNKITMFISTISIAEYCVRGVIDELPLRNLKILPFNHEHGIQAGKFARIIFDNKNNLALDDRKVISADAKLFAQAHVEKAVQYYVTSDSRSESIYNLLKQSGQVHFQFIPLTQPLSETFGTLDL